MNTKRNITRKHHRLMYFFSLEKGIVEILWLKQQVFSIYKWLRSNFLRLQRTRGVDSCVDLAKTNRSPGLVFVNRFWLMWSWSSCRFVASGLKYSVGWPGSYSSLHDENLQRTKIFTNFGPFFQTYPFKKINYIHFSKQFTTVTHIVGLFLENEKYDENEIY